MNHGLKTGQTFLVQDSLTITREVQLKRMDLIQIEGFGGTSSKSRVVKVQILNFRDDCGCLSTKTVLVPYNRLLKHYHLGSLRRPAPPVTIWHHLTGVV